MPSSKIGDYQFITLRGALTPGGESLQEITRPGVDGHAWRKAGKRGAVHQLMPIVDVTSAANVATLVTNILALQGADPVTIYDDQGNYLANAKVLLAEHVRTRTVVGASGGVNDGNYLVQFRIQVQASQ